MVNYIKKQNFYGDIILSADYINPDLLDYLTNNNSDTYLILKLKNKPDNLPAGFSFITYYKYIYIYANQAAKKACPIIDNNIISSSVLFILIKTELNSYFVLVKDKTKNYLTNPSGSLSELSETFEACAIREAFEETGLIINNITHIGSLTRLAYAFDMDFHNITKIFSTEINLPESDLSKIKLYSDSEIEKIYIIPTDFIFENIKNYNGQKILEHHYIIASYYINKLKNNIINIIKPDYLKTFELF